MIISIISIILLIILSSILLLLYNNKKQKLEKEYKEEYYNNHYQELLTQKQAFDRQIEEYREKANHDFTEWAAAQTKERERIEQSLIERKKAVEEIIEQLECRRREAEKLRDAAVVDGKEKIDIEVAGYRKLKLEQANNELEKEITSKRSITLKEFGEFTELIERQRAEYKEELQAIIDQLDDYKKRQAAINEEILRRREVEEKQDFFRVVLTNEAKQDIKYLISIIDNIKNSALLYKLIWSEYIQKPFNTMLKNITGGKEIKCVIYKITNIGTQEIYIGKTKADVAKRWTEHIKTSLNIGTVARSKIHDALFRHWDEFTFEILEVVDDEMKLSQREKYYINFYQSNIYGYNMNSGG